VTALLAASPGDYASAPAVLVTLVAVIVLLGIRAWCGTAGVALTRQVLLLLDGAAAALTVMFFVLVAVRFVTVV
jgi:hypothetical protein